MSLLSTAQDRIRYLVSWLEKASRRSFSAYHVPQPRNKEEEYLPARDPLLFDVSGIFQFFSLRLLASIEMRDSETMRKQIEICAKFIEATQIQSTLVSNILHHWLMGAIWYGLKTKAFSRDDLEWIFSRVGEMNLRERTIDSLRTEYYVNAPLRLNACKSSVPAGARILWRSGFWFPSTMNDKLKQIVLPGVTEVGCLRQSEAGLSLSLIRPERKK